MNRYLKVSVMWISLPTLTGFILAWLGRGHGGASAMLLIFLFLLGIAGAAIHCEIIALSSSKFNNKIYATLCLLVVFLSIAWLTLADPTCTYIEQDAAAKIGKHLAQLKYNPDHLGAAKFSKKDCSYSYTYTGSEGKIEFLFSPWGDIHTWDYDAQR